LNGTQHRLSLPLIAGRIEGGRMMKSLACWFGTALVPLMLVPQAWAADAFPNRPLRIIVNTAPGGLTDVETRLVAQKMSDKLGQPIVVENRAGGDGLIGIQAVKSAKPDGYTLLGTAYTIAIQMVMKQDPGYDLTRDFIGVGAIGRSPFLLVEAPSLPDKSFKDFIARAKANPGKLTYASAGVGTVPHLAMEALVQNTGVSLLHVPYKGNGAAMPDVLSGRVDTILEAYGSSAAKIKAGQLKALGITSANRSPALPDVPTIAEQGAPGYAFYTWLSLIAPAGTPKDVVQTLSDALRYATGSPEVQAKFRDDGMETMDMGVDEFNQYLGAEVKRVEKLVGDLKLPKQ
jgi:tripartite-type tricarboxylate transporter receptor subunit TctC